MKKFINKTTGAEMQVADNRAKEYETAGHTLVVSKPAKSKKRYETAGHTPAASAPKKPAKKRKGK